MYMRWFYNFFGTDNAIYACGMLAGGKKYSQTHTHTLI